VETPKPGRSAIFSASLDLDHRADPSLARFPSAAAKVTPVAPPAPPAPAADASAPTGARALPPDTTVDPEFLKSLKVRCSPHGHTTQEEERSSIEVSGDDHG
jgi:hypothetical protein